MNTQSGDALVAGAAALAIQLSNGLTPDQTATLAAFFTCLGDNLALISVQRSQNL